MFANGMSINHFSAGSLVCTLVISTQMLSSFNKIKKEGRIKDVGGIGSHYIYISSNNYRLNKL